MHSPEHMRKKAEARKEALHHFHHAAVHEMREKMPEKMEGNNYEREVEQG